MKWSLKYLGFVVVLFSTSNCSPAPETRQAATETVVVSQSSRWQSLNIPVCWEGEFNKILRSNIKNFVTKNINDKTVLKLTGWEICEANAQGIRIFVYDDPIVPKTPALAKIKRFLQANGTNSMAGHPRALGIGREISGQSPGLILTEQLTDVDPFLKTMAKKFTNQGKNYLLESIALHEMGHAIGLLHEDSHPQKTCSKYAEPASGVAITAYNHDSFMSRCYYRDYPYYDKGPLGINEKDAEGINKAYAFLGH